MSRSAIVFAGKKSAQPVFLLLCILITLTFSCSRQQESVRVGAILSLSGPGGYLSGLRDALVMAVEEINGTGGINGRPIELFIEDSRTDPEEGKRAMERLEAQHHPVVYLSNMSAVSMALAPLAEQMEVPLIGLVTSAQEFTTGRKWVFRYYALAREEVSPVLAILNRLGTKHLEVFYQDEPYGQSVFHLLSAGYRESGRVRVSGQPFANVEIREHL